MAVRKSTNYSPRDGTFTIEVSTDPVETKDKYLNVRKSYRWALLFHNGGESFVVLSGYSNSIEDASKVAIHYYRECVLHGKED